MPADPAGAAGARYHFAYAEDSPYGHAVRLLAAHTHVPGGLVLDLGCGFGAIAEPVRDLGLCYVGLDREATGLEDLASRGFEHAVVDLGDTAALRSRLEEVVSSRPVAAIVALDVVEHLVNGPAVLAVLHEVALGNGRPPLVVSIPNVTHLDLAAKLLVGRWDVTPTGLLDETHVALYSPDRLARTFSATGWEEIGAEDFPLEQSDQHFPPDAAPLAATPLHELLAALRDRAAPGARTNQFVRAYAPVAVVEGARAVVGREELDPPGPFLSVVLCVAGSSAAELDDALLALDAQSVTAFELVVVARSDSLADRGSASAALLPFDGGLSSRARVVPGPPPGVAAPEIAALAAGVRAATGRYVTFLDGERIAFANLVETFSRLASQRPGAVLRAQGLVQPVRSVAWPDGRPGLAPTAGAARGSLPRYSLLDHLAVPSTPRGSWALPRSCFTVLGCSLEGAPPGLAEDELLALAASYCGVAEASDEVVVLHRRRDRDGPGEGGLAARASLVERLDASPVLLPAGSLAGLVASRPIAADGASRATASRDAPGPPGGPAPGGPGATDDELEGAWRELERARHELAELRSSTSWRLTAPLRRASAALRRRR